RRAARRARSVHRASRRPRCGLQGARDAQAVMHTVEARAATLPTDDACACVGGCACAVDAPAIADLQARRWAWWLTAATITWNSLVAVIAIAGGIVAGSIALVGFGLDSVVEVASA